MSEKNYGGELIIPVYINQRIVFDLVATMRDGISTVTRISQSESDENQKGTHVAGSFGLSAALTNFIKVDLQGRSQSDKRSSLEKQKTEERYHTPTSLFARLLKELRQSHDVIRLEDHWSTANVKAGQLIEIDADLRVNPILEICEVVASTYEFTQGFMRTSGSTKQRQPNALKNAPPQIEDPAQYGIRMTKKMAESIRQSNTIDLVATGMGSNITGVITIENEFLNDPRMADLMDGRFRIVGKISRVVRADDPPISLLRNCPFGRLPDEMLKTLLASFDYMRPHVKIPDAQTEVPGPAIQIIPVAIFA